MELGWHSQRVLEKRMSWRLQWQLASSSLTGQHPNQRPVKAPKFALKTSMGCTSPKSGFYVGELDLPT